MTVAVRMPCRLPVLVLLGVLAAPAAGAGDAPVAPFPGTSGPGASVSGVLEDDGGSNAEAAPPPALGAEAAGPAARHETVAPPDAGREMPEVAAPDAGAVPTDAALPHRGMAAEKAAAPAGGSEARCIGERDA